MKVELYVLKSEGGRVPKAHDITKVRLREVKLDKSYEDYMWPAILWATEDAESLAKALDVEKVFAQGSYIRGLFGGERRGGSEPYAGLVVVSSRPAANGLYIRLYNTDKEYWAPVALLRRYGVDIYKMYYVGLINPFKCSTYDVILSTRGEEGLRGFLTNVIDVNKSTMTEGDERRLRKLVDELRAQVDTLSSGSHYVVYRGKRVFSACVPEDLSKSICESDIAYVKCKSAEQAYYYAAVLNYMAYKVIKEGRTFIRDQYARPLLAITVSNLTWNDLSCQLREEISRLSLTLSKKLKRMKWVDYSSKKTAILKTAEENSEFKDIIELLDRHVEDENKQANLKEALELVSTVETRRK